ncbi:phosphatidylinositol-glycan biosynthesis class X protein [Vulpes lagopus]|uniref:phosphatidylinositol-glycan biosynthesis class X protein n=1 Tax=Vulpes lagopus TaxID=494514 RepID=UPI001BC94CD6|nr:phosphatidylinositol-glycan biosynthesis class X protein [Vulpes lagopus]
MISSGKPANVKEPRGKAAQGDDIFTNLILLENYQRNMPRRRDCKANSRAEGPNPKYLEAAAAAGNCRAGSRNGVGGRGPHRGPGSPSGSPPRRSFPQQQRWRPPRRVRRPSPRPLPEAEGRGGEPTRRDFRLPAARVPRKFRAAGSRGPQGCRRAAPSSVPVARYAAARSRSGGRRAQAPSGRISSPRAPWGSAFCGVLAARTVGVQAVAWLLLCEAAGLSGTPAAPAGAGKKATCSEIILRQEVLKDGFHRDLLIKVKFGESIEDLQTCRLLIKQYIPTGLFVDPYELASLQESNITEAVMVSEDFNIEAPNYLSKESEVLIYARQDSQCIDCFQAFLPVHYRYHRPHSKDGETFIVVNNPDLLMYCDQELPILKCWAQSQVAAPCTLKNKDICQWNNMKYKSVFKNVTLQVPVGLTIHTSLVCSVTLLITILCSTLILLAVFKYGHFSL